MPPLETSPEAHYAVTGSSEADALLLDPRMTPWNVRSESDFAGDYILFTPEESNPSGAMLVLTKELDFPNEQIEFEQIALDGGKRIIFGSAVEEEA